MSNDFYPMTSDFGGHFVPPTKPKIGRHLWSFLYIIFFCDLGGGGGFNQCPPGETKDSRGNCKKTFLSGA